jgi:hypothetical protein
MSLNREQRRLLKKKLAPIAKEVAAIENIIKITKDTTEKEELEAQIAKIMEGLTLTEMMALEDYITNKGLLDN